eukprot:3307506-Rhodomonas_salina.1
MMTMMMMMTTTMIGYDDDDGDDDDDDDIMRVMRSDNSCVDPFVLLAVPCLLLTEATCGCTRP